MADSNSTSTCDVGTGNIHSGQSANLSDVVDKIDSNFGAAIAIIDCVSVLIALERMPALPATCATRTFIAPMTDYFNGVTLFCPRPDDKLMTA